MSDYQILLFDIDGVLVAPYGYRESVRATLGHFYRQMNFPESFLPDEDVISGFEAIRITSEWDMVPICLAAAIDGWLAANPEFILSDQLSTALPEIGDAASTTNLPRDPGYLRLQQSLSGLVKPGEYPADTVLRRVRSERPSALLTHLSGSCLLDSLLAHSRDLNQSVTTRVFQHFTLGSRAFQACYNQVPSFQSESLLAEFDLPLLPAELSQRLLDLHTQREIYPAAFTMRPSLAPRSVDDHLPNRYAPEAEIALELVRLSDIPLIGYGRILYLANQIGLEAEELLKPSPVQAIAAILAAISGNEILALTEAYHVYAKSGGFPISLLNPGDRLIVHIFEDSAGGIEAVFRAAAILRSIGISVQVSGYGIATHPRKTAALEKAGAAIHSSTVQAVLQALAAIRAG
jgi:hypothetical protein